MYVVTVLFELDAGHTGAFRSAIIDNARTSLLEEEGCHRFDVAFSENGLRCFLYELYTDRAAFDTHLRTEHFLAFDRTSGGMVQSKRVETYVLAQDAVPGPERRVLNADV